MLSDRILSTLEMGPPRRREALVDGLTGNVEVRGHFLLCVALRAPERAERLGAL
jgi:hypothetical protein